LVYVKATVSGHLMSFMVHFQTSSLTLDLSVTLVVIAVSSYERWWLQTGKHAVVRQVVALGISSVESL